jgi:hypothetical protein
MLALGQVCSLKNNMENKMSAKVFISYSNVDEGFAKQLTHILDGIGIEYFLDSKDIKVSDSISDKVRKGLSACSAVVVIISPASLKSQWVPYEIGHATALGKKIIPLLTHPSLEVPTYLHDLKYTTHLEDVKEYLKVLFELPSTKKDVNPKSERKESPKQRDKIRAERNEMLIAELRQKDGIRDCSVFQLEDHTDKGFLIFVEFDEEKTNAADVVSTIRTALTTLFPNIPIWGEMKTEADNSVGFAYTYIDEYNKIFRKGKSAQNRTSA